MKTYKLVCLALICTFLLPAIGCNEQPTEAVITKNSNNPKDSKNIAATAKQIISVALADGMGAEYGCAWGLTAGPMGGVLGFLIGGCVASYGASPIMMGGYPTNPMNPASSPYNVNVSSIDSVGFHHNEMLKRLAANSCFTLTGAPDYTAMYNTVDTYLTNTGINSRIDTLVSLSAFSDSLTVFQAAIGNTTTAADCKAFMSARIANSNYRTVIFAAIDDMNNALTVSAAISALNTRQSNLGLVVLTTSEREKANMFIATAKYSLSLWNNN